MHYIYKITNTVNNKIYIGQTINPTERWYAHKSKHKKIRMVIERAFEKYGSIAFIFEVIATCRTQDDANDCEIIVIKQYDSTNPIKGYNISEGGSANKAGHVAWWITQNKSHPALGHKAEFTPERRKRMSESHKGQVPNNKLDLDKEQQVIDLYLSGIKYKEIVELTGVGKTTVIRIVKRNKLPLRVPTLSTIKETK